MFPQKLIYKQMKIIGAVRVIKGQEVLRDGSTLEEHGITDGSTINIVIEPAKEINLHVKHGPRVVTCSVNNSLCLGDLKQKLIDDDIIGFSFDEFGLFLSADDNAGLTSDVSLDDSLLPLNRCGVSDNTTIRILGGSVLVNLIGPKKEHWTKAFPKTMTINQMKKAIMPLASFLKNIPSQGKLVIDFILFLKRGTTYKKLQGEVPIGTVLSNDDKIYLIDDSFCGEHEMVVVHYGREVVGRIPLIGGTALSVKLRVQSQLGFPVSCIDVKTPDGSSVADHHDFYYNTMQVFVS